MPTPIKAPSDLRPGDYYEDCFFHPCLCTRVDSDEINGISLVDGTSPRGCSVGHCGVRKLTLAEALHWKFFGPTDQAVPADSQWWYENPGEEWREVYRL